MRHLIFAPSEAPLSPILKNWTKSLTLHDSLAKVQSNFGWLAWKYFGLNYSNIHDFFQINIEPLYISVTSSHVIVASRDAFYVWHFRTAQSWTTLRLDSSNKNPAQNANSKSSERLYHVDDAPGGMYSFFPVNFFT